MKPWRHLVCTALLASVGCSPPDWTDRDEETGTTVMPIEDEQMQGTHLLGYAMDLIPGSDADHHFSASRFGTGFEVHFVGSASLDRPAGILPASNGDQLKFTRFGPQGDTTQYVVRRFDAAAARWGDPCQGTTAIPLLGTFTRDRVHEYDPDRLSFSCVPGVAAKCNAWGYGPGSDPTERAGWRAHQVCMQMANGDVCGRGIPHTREGTVIAIADFVGIFGEPPAQLEGVRAWPPPPDEFYFEAAYVDGHEPAFCRGKARWQSLLPDQPGECDVNVPDPREDPDAHYCEDYDWDGDPTTGGDVPLPAGVEILLVNASAYNDLALHVWHSGYDQVATIQGYADNRPSLAPFDGDWQHSRRDALLLRRPTGTQDLDLLVPAHIFVGPTGDHVLGPVEDTLASWPPPGYTIPPGTPQEGWLFRDGSRPGTLPLILYVRTVAGQPEYLSAAFEPPAEAGYVRAPIDPIGWVIAPSE